MGRPDKRQGNRSVGGSRRTPANLQEDPAERALKSAETLQQQAERKKGPDAIVAHQKAAEKFREALSYPFPHALSPSHTMEAHFGLGESLQNWAEAVLETAQKLPDDQCTSASHAEAENAAKQLLQQAVTEYKQVVSDNGVIRCDAAVNCGNCLATWAEMEAPEAAKQLLTEAEAAYQAGLSTEEDAATWSNLGDAQVLHAELHCGPDGGEPAWEAAQQLYNAAMCSYQKACCVCHAENGDDLPGLLHNWGVGAHSMAVHLRNLDPPAAMKLLEEAAQRLRESISFQRGDPDPFNALGDVLAAAADRTTETTQKQELLESALSEGYRAALHINANNADAKIGVAEVHSEFGRIAQSSGVTTEAARSFSAAADTYLSVLQHPTSIGGFKERANVRYNCCCALVLCGRYPEAAEMLEGLLGAGSISIQDLLSDEDFAGVREAPWFQGLLAAGQHMMH